MAAIFGPGGPIILPWTVRGDHFSGGTVHGVTGPLSEYYIISCIDHTYGHFSTQESHKS